MKKFWIGMLGLLLVFCVTSCKKSEEPKQEEKVTEQKVDKATIEDILAKAKADGAKWTEAEWKDNVKKVITGIAPIYKKIGDLQKEMGDGEDPAKAAQYIGELTKVMEEFEPYDNLFDTLDSIANTSEVGKAVINDSTWMKGVMKELGIDDIDI